ncbi:MAG TPA: ABC transporter permease [bacterium]|nr:ABC transporter permease [bacterium]
MIRPRERLWMNLAVGLIYVFLLAPVVVVVLAALNSGAYLRFPPEGLSFRWFVAFAHSRSFVRSLRFSLELATVVTVTSTIVGAMASLWVVRFSGRLRNTLRILMIAPLAVPGILTGIALLIFFYAVGWEKAGLAGLIVGHTLICVPYVFLITTAVLIRFDRTLEEAARNLGAGPFKTFWRITLPLIKGGVISGAVFAFVTSYDEFNISLLLSGVGTTPLPIELFDYLRFSFDPTAAVAGTISIGMALVVVLITQRLVGLESLYLGGD